MPTHDYVIDNQTAPSFRADLNGALQAIVSNNSSASAPSTTYANMVWYDTANNQFKMRSEADDAWIVLGTVDETAGTFTVSGVPDIATQLEAEDGTDNTVLMTPLRTKQAIEALTLGPEFANMPAWYVTPGGVGTYVFARSGGDQAFGATVAGSSLRPTSAIYSQNVGSADSSSTQWSFDLGTALSGTWQCMGTSDASVIASFEGNGTAQQNRGATLWQRIA